ncbi:hypothetical protein [Enterobacter sp. CC120223-11]|uniref:hypothetical protein n=1 Tax=Enterobacter sp. CC120223-11 TaxID=1378073 RepID=UPI000BCE814F|nr:hypothetical protein [Enterobacter sp. CC120223-11]SNY61409.1 DNA-binding response regulator, NarL/FixJ family, contains REC and HTH domains [Enterobacter sp. CC120223-11]
MTTIQKKLNIALIDSCSYTQQGFSQIISHTHGKGVSVNTFGFATLSELNESEVNFDIIIYDPMQNSNIIVDINRDVTRIKQWQPQSRVFIFSTAVGIIKQPLVDGMFSKQTALNDLSSLWEMIINKAANREGYLMVNVTIAHTPSLNLSNSELSVLRGYYANLRTKQIASCMGCDVKRVYYYKKTAIDKIEAMANSPFYNSARRFLN